MEQWNELRFHIRHLTIEEQDRVERAYFLGDKAHEGQKRQSGEIYFSHPIAVAHLLADMGADCDTIIGALLHDTVEDTPLTLQEISAEFGTSVATLIDGVTKMSEREMAANPTLNEQIETLRKMFNLMQNDVRIMVIKLADRLHNMQTISFRSKEKQIAVARETMDVYVKIADRLCMRDIRDELQGMCLAVLEPDIYLQLQELRRSNQERSKIVLPYMRDQLKEKFKKNYFTIDYELKSWESMRLQYNAELEGNTQLSIMNLAFICPDVEKCYLTMGMLHQIWRRESLSFEDFMNAPIINGYKAIHTTVILENGTRIRCKIRTKEMNEYAHKGITLKCFDKKSKGVLEYLPWTNRISPLSEDTTEKSTEFWQSLQNDILGESILIHGDGDQTQLLPTHATALDGVFYLYGERGLFTKEIFVNGKTVPFYEELEYAGTVHATFSATPVVELNWLQYTHTGIGIALIRSALSKQDSGLKRSEGQKLLQLHLNAHRRGFISEFNRLHIERILHEQNYPSLEDLYIQIAEGRISVQEVENVIFRTQKPKVHPLVAERRAYTLTCNVPLANKNALRDVMQYYTIKSMRTLGEFPTHGVYKLVALLTEEEYRTFSFTLDHIIPGRYTLREKRSFYAMGIFSILLFVLWGLDPAAGHFLLNRPGVSPIDMTVIRFITLTILSGGFMLWMRSRQPLPEARLSLRSTSLWLSVIFLFCVSIASYYALQHTFPSHYTIPMTSAGLLLTTIVNRKHVWTLAATWSLVGMGIALLIALTPEWDMQSMMYTLLAVIAFAGFSLISERYKRQEQVSLRAAQYFFMLSALCTLFSIVLIPFMTLGDITRTDLLLIVLFSIFISGLPYYIYYYLLSHKEIDFVLRYSFLIIPATLISEIVLIDIPALYTFLAALLVAFGAFLPIARINHTDQSKVLA